MNKYYKLIKIKFLSILTLSVLTINVGVGQTSFTGSDVELPVGTKVGNPTSLEWGPDGKLYVAQQDGSIKILTISKVASNNYKATNLEEIKLVKLIPNYNDDGTFKADLTKRQVTGLVMGGTSSDPLIYVNSSDPRIGAGEYGDVDLCTNSGVISKLYKDGGTWKKVDLVRGLPRSEENHSSNGMQLYDNGKKLLIAIGGTTNAGGPSKPWTYVTEYALSAAILVVDLQAIEALPTKTDAKGQLYKYDIPTLDDPTRPNVTVDGVVMDINDPWGGNDGINQAKIVPGGPVQIFSGGWRNAYDILVSKHSGREGRVYTIDNGPNGNWGGYPDKGYPLGTGGSATNKYLEGEPGSLSVGNYDGLEYIGNVNSYVPGSYYGGHPVPVRANVNAGLYTDNGTHRGWRNDNSNPNLPLPNDWPPVPASMINPIEGEFHNPGTAEDKSIIYWETSMNGFCEYLYPGNEFYGDLFVAAFDNPGNIYRIKMDASHNVVNQKNAKRINLDAPIFTGFGNKPLDITCAASGPFAGSLWVATWGSSKITVFEPKTLSGCAGTYSTTLDEDGDGYKNSDELDNGTNPCSASSQPSDNDHDNVSDRNDTDDDNDGILDKNDFFAVDFYNGDTTTIPTHFNLFNYDPGTGFFGLGFTGLMCNNQTDYIDQFEATKMIAGGAAGAVTLEEVPSGDAFENLNDQRYAFQFGVKVTPVTGMFTVKGAIMPAYFSQQTPSGFQSQGIYIGNGDQDNYIKMVLHANDGQGGIQVLKEEDGVVSSSMVSLNGQIPVNKSILFYLTIDKSTNLVYPRYSIDGVMTAVGSPIPLTGKLLQAITQNGKAMAVGIISTSRSAPNFNASWDYIEVYEGNAVISGISKARANGQDNINIFPNPGRDKVSISIDSEIPQNYKIRIYNSVGHEVKTMNVFNVSGSISHELEINELTNGIYFLHFTSEKEKRSTTVKLVKK
jgi:hypothetical protein